MPQRGDGSLFKFAHRRKLLNRVTCVQTNSPPATLYWAGALPISLSAMEPPWSLRVSPLVNIAHFGNVE
jgi:hypothetical protein